MQSELIVVKEVDCEDEGSTDGAQSLDAENEEYAFENGAVYKGQWLSKKRHGFGVQTWPDGASLVLIPY